MNNTTLKNLTPHDIAFADQDGNIVLSIGPEPTPARCAISTVHLGYIEVDGVQVEQVQAVYGQVSGLPDPQEGVIYITSTPAAIRACGEGRTDVYSPRTDGTAIRNEKGQIVAVRGIQRPI